MGYLDYAGLQYLWSKLKEKFAPKSHSHDDRYYTEAEMDGKLNSKVDNNEAGADSLLSKLTTSWTATPTDDTYFIRQDTGGANQFGRVKFSTIWNYIKGKADGTYQPKGSYAASGHTHTKDQVGLGNVDNTADANKSVKYATSAGNASKVNNHTVNIDVPANAKFTDTNTWRGIQNNLTSDSTDQSLSAAQGKALKALVDGKAPTSHKHTKSQITDFPSSMPASDVYAWAKAATKPSYTKAEVGLGNVDNTADKNKSVNYATTAKTASTGLNGISSSGTNYVRFYNGTQICWMSQSSKVSSSSTSITWTFQVPFKDNNYCFVYSHYRSATGRGITKTASTVTCNFSVILTECSMLAIGCWK